MRTESITLAGGSDEDVLTRLGEYAIDRGYAEAGYVDALLEREANHPTGLDVPTKGFGIAIPHADPDFVTEAAALVGLAPPGEAIEFASMDDPDQTVEVEVVILLLVNETEGYTTFLSNLAKLFQANEFATLVRRRDGDGLLGLVVDRCIEVDA